MNIHQQEQKFLDYLEGTLSPEESAALKAELERSSELKRSFEKYRAVVETEKMIAGESLELHPNFTVKVLNKIENQPVGALGRVAAAIRRNSVALISSAATLATLILVVRVSDDYSERQFAPASPSESKAVAPVQQKEESSLPSAAVRNEIDAVKALPPAEESQKLKRSLQADLKAPPEGIEKFGFDGEPQRLDSKDNVPSLISPKKSMPVIPAPASKPDEGRAVAGKGVGSVSSGSSFLFEGNAGSAPAKTEQNAASRVYDDRKSQSLEVADLMGAPAGGAKQRVQEELSDEVYRRRETDERTAEIYSRVMERFKELKKEEESKISALPLGPIPAAEQYRTYEENKRLNVASVPSSTFSIDVDTASYTNARRQLLQGVMPPRDSIRIEEFINYFDYDYPAEFEKPFGLSYEIAPSPLESDRYLLRLGIKAKDVSHSPKPWNLVFLIDVSGSMADG
ncbi:MAG: von Willebrand factor type A domain-containing protein, partial [Deltaproteobacteria bacterium]|nr:von Willebrand factor type A domain-containing protein [Deltaproteobacteria bacterium]